MASKECDRQIAAALHPEAVGVGFADQAAFGSKFTVIHWLGENREFSNRQISKADLDPEKVHQWNILCEMALSRLSSPSNSWPWL